MKGRISPYFVIPLVCIAAIIGITLFYTGSTIATSGNPNPPYPNANQSFIGSNFFSNLQGFVHDIDTLGKALNRITPTTGPQFTDLTAYVDTGVAIVRIMLDLPMLIITFLYDIVRILLFFLPAHAPPEFMAMIAILTLIPIIYILLEIASAIRSPGLGKW